MKNVFLVLAALCLIFAACDSNETLQNEASNNTENENLQLTDSEQKLKEWDECVAANPAGEAEMTGFIDRARLGVVVGGYYVVENDDYISVGDVWDGTPNANFLFDDGVMRAVGSVGPGHGEYAYSYEWVISKESPLTIVFTDEAGLEHATTLVTTDEEYYYFEGNWPILNSKDESTLKRFVANIRVDEDVERRAEAEARYENARVENE